MDGEETPGGCEDDGLELLAFEIVALSHSSSSCAEIGLGRRRSIPVPELLDPPVAGLLVPFKLRAPMSARRVVVDALEALEPDLGGASPRSRCSSTTYSFSAKQPCQQVRHSQTRNQKQ